MYGGDVMLMMLCRIPLYGLLKVGFLVWLAAPQFSGAEFLYNAFIADALDVGAEYLSTVPALEEYVKPFLHAKKVMVKKKDDDAGAISPTADAQ